MKLDVAERIRLLGILPEKGNLLTIKIVSELRDNLSFSEKELKDWNIKTKENAIRWSDKAEKKEVRFGEQATEIVVKALKDMDEKEELIQADIALWDYFLGEKK
jgi:hypothetical protein